MASRGTWARLTCLFCLVLVARPAPVAAADTWTEITGGHAVVIAGSVGEGRKIAWQLEQIRRAVVKILPWVRTDLDRPFLVLAVNNETRMRALVPEYWERSGAVKPDSVWVTGADRHYLAIRSDQQAEDRRLINPHVNAYFAYVSLVVQHSLERDMPLWFTRGLAGLLSNTIVHDSYLMVGPPIPWHLQTLRSGSRLLLPALVSVTRDSREFNDGEGLRRFDAQAWAFVHFLMFADDGARQAKITEFFRLVSSGTPADAALSQALGKMEQLERAYTGYLNREIFSFAKLEADASVKRDVFVDRPLSPVEAASLLALFHTAMQRPVEARAAIAEARKHGPAPDTYVAEALLLGREQKSAEAEAALTRAVAEGTTSAYAYYELARLRWRADADREALSERQRLLARATAIHPQSARALAMLAEVRSQLGASDALALVARAIRLEPAQAAHRLTAAVILWRSGQRADALKAVEVAMTLAISDDDRQRARELQAAIEREKPPPR